MAESSSKLIVELEILAATYPYQNNQTFDYVNGDMHKLKFRQRIVAQKIDQEPLPYEGEGSSLDEAMEDKGPVQDAIFNESKFLD